MFANIFPRRIIALYGTNVGIGMKTPDISLFKTANHRGITSSFEIV